MIKQTLVASLALVLLATGASFAGTADGPPAEHQMEHERHHGSEAGPGSHEEKREKHREKMKEHRQQMLTKLKEQTAELDALLERLHAAEGDARVDAVAAVLDELVGQHQMHMGQRIEMMEKMGEAGGGMPGMHSGMMKGDGHHCRHCPCAKHHGEHEHEHHEKHHEKTEKMEKKSAGSSPDGR